MNLSPSALREILLAGNSPVNRFTTQVLDPVNRSVRDLALLLLAIYFLK